jgi:hypothetical protein
MKLPINVLNFTNGDTERQEGYKKFKEYYNAYKNNKDMVGTISFSEANDKMLNFFIEEIEKLSGKSAKNYNDMMQFAMFTDVKEAAFAVVGMLTDLVIPDALMKDLGAIATIKTVGWGDTLKIDIQPRDLFVVSKGGRAKRSFDIQRQFKGTKTIVPEPTVISVGVSLYDVLAGKYTLAEFVSKAAQSVEVQMRYDIYDCFAKAMSALSTNSDLYVNGYTQDAAVKLAQTVKAWNGGAEPIYLGTKVAVSKILPASTNYRFNLGDEYTSLGHVREFFGTDVVELEQIADYKSEFKLKLPDDVIYVVCPTTDKIVKVAIEGSTLSNVENNYDNANLMTNANLVKSYGVGVATSAIAGMIKLS